ncbi:MAG: type IV toxin-antitoxin system AbiEi family antitoxin domain-containing protein [Micrococcales bacterium]|nr:type IV toxin-antitoxin system AbiEi family antitoxin domain-containing protein [Micrococcales bacterium]
MGTDACLTGRAFTLAEAAGAGIARASVYRRVDAGELAKIGPGLFVRADDEQGLDHDLVAAVTRAPLATICLTSALARHGLVDAIPGSTDLALPRGAYRPRLGPAVTWHQFDAGTFDLGRVVTPLAGTDGIGIYEPERAIVDVFRMRGLEGYEVGLEALRAWLRRPGAHPASLMRLAEQLPRAVGPLRTALACLT